jgi:hypothetical protein
MVWRNEEGESSSIIWLFFKLSVIHSYLLSSHHLNSLVDVVFVNHTRFIAVACQNMKAKHAHANVQAIRIDWQGCGRLYGQARAITTFHMCSLWCKAK